MIAALVLPAAIHSAVAPPNRLVAFNTLPRGWFGALPRDVRKDARIVRLSTGQRVAVAPTRNGNFCEAFASFGGCRVRPGFEGRFAPMIDASLMARSGRLIVIAGNVVAAPEHSLYLVHRDGATQIIPLTYVTHPIGAGFFYASIPAELQRGSKAPARLQLRRGKVVVESSRIVLPRRR
jgi:hypothetical protein